MKHIKSFNGLNEAEVEEFDVVDIEFKEDTEIEVFKSEKQAESGKGTIEKYKKGDKETDVDVLSVKGDFFHLQFGNGDVSTINKNSINVTKK